MVCDTVTLGHSSLTAEQGVYGSAIEPGLGPWEVSDKPAPFLLSTALFLAQQNKYLVSGALRI